MIHPISTVYQSATQLQNWQSHHIHFVTFYQSHPFLSPFHVPMNLQRPTYRSQLSSKLFLTPLNILNFGGD